MALSERYAPTPESRFKWAMKAYRQHFMDIPYNPHPIDLSLENQTAIRKAIQAAYSDIDLPDLDTIIGAE